MQTRRLFLHDTSTCARITIGLVSDWFPACFGFQSCNGQSSPYSMFVSITLCTQPGVYRLPMMDTENGPVSQEKVDLGELMLSLCYLPTAGRLTLTVIKGRNFKAMDITGKSGTIFSYDTEPGGTEVTHIREDSGSIPGPAILISVSRGFPKSLQANAAMGPKQRSWPIPSQSFVPLGDDNYYIAMRLKSANASKRKVQNWRTVFSPCQGVKILRTDYRKLAMLILHKAEEYTTGIQLDLKQVFQKCRFERAQPIRLYDVYNLARDLFDTFSSTRSQTQRSNEMQLRPRALSLSLRGTVVIARDGGTNTRVCCTHYRNYFKINNGTHDNDSVMRVEVDGAHNRVIKSNNLRKEETEGNKDMCCELLLQWSEGKAVHIELIAFKINFLQNGIASISTHFNGHREIFQRFDSKGRRNLEWTIAQFARVEPSAAVRKGRYTHDIKAKRSAADVSGTPPSAAALLLLEAFATTATDNSINKLRLRFVSSELSSGDYTALNPAIVFTNDLAVSRLKTRRMSADGTPPSLDVLLEQCLDDKDLVRRVSSHNIRRTRPAWRVERVGMSWHMGIANRIIGAVHARSSGTPAAILFAILDVGKYSDGPAGDIGAGAKEAGNASNSVLGSSADKLCGSNDDIVGVAAKEVNGAALVAVEAGSDFHQTTQNLRKTSPSKKFTQKDETTNRKPKFSLLQCPRKHLDHTTQIAYLQQTYETHGLRWDEGNMPYEEILSVLESVIILYYPACVLGRHQCDLPSDLVTKQAGVTSHSPSFNLSISQTGSFSIWVTHECPHVAIVPDDAAGRRVFSRISGFLHPYIPALLRSHLAPPLSSAVKTSFLRVAQISLNSSRVRCQYGQGPRAKVKVTDIRHIQGAGMTERE
ncbi:hypothetical protein PR048_000756 [Dryococelus australis]|uniref:Uncharacterized protein n=1 Tax=Dryococelus australis TaxID=614101 RepID=A0ABQ9IFJ4_9NEOP|nr:hypothetical protein PR048_000756 [Dryococelus australis]